MIGAEVAGAVGGALVAVGTTVAIGAAGALVAVGVAAAAGAGAVGGALVAVGVAAAAGAGVAHFAAGAKAAPYVPTALPPALFDMALPQTWPCGWRWNLMPPARLS